MKRSSSSNDSNQKRLACSSLTRKSFVSGNALLNVLDDIKANGLPNAYSRSSQHRSRKEFANQQTDYGPLIIQVDMEIQFKKKTSVIKVGLLNPAPYIKIACDESTVYASAVLRALSSNPSGPNDLWSTVLYQDGVDPGDGLTKEKSRHMAVFYWSFLNLSLIHISEPTRPY